jgi:hypothetical protein
MNLPVNTLGCLPHLPPYIAIHNLAGTTESSNLGGIYPVGSIPRIGDTDTLSNTGVRLLGITGGLG